MAFTRYLHRSVYSQQIIGWLAVFASTFCFYFATVAIRWSQEAAAIDSAFFAFARFALGFAVVCSTMAVGRRLPRPKRYHYLLGRTVANTVAVFFFYKAVEVGSVAEANILNMTYPLFVALFSWMLLRGQRDPAALPIVGVAFVGIWLILSPGSVSLSYHNMWGLASGIVAAWAMIYLNVSRRYHDSQTILFFMFGLGSLFIYIGFRDSIHWPDSREFYYLTLSSTAGVAGQYLLTYGFLFVTAVEGSIISSSRILMAALLGPALVGDPPLVPAGWLGALLIFAANSALALRKSRVRPLDGWPSAAGDGHKRAGH